MVRLFVGGLARDITSEQLASRFETFGSVTKCTVIGPKSTDPFKGADVTCRGFGYLELDPANDSALRKCLTVVCFADSPNCSLILKLCFTQGTAPVPF